MDKEKLGAELERIVLAKIARDALVIPALPSVASEALDLLRESDFETRRMVAILERDPGIVAQVIRIATSAGAGGGAKSMSLEQALARIGQNKLRTVVVELCARRLFSSRDARIDEVTSTLWEHSLATAVLARDLTAMCGGMDAGTAYLAGLLHDVGKPILAAMLLDAERQLGGPTGARWITADDFLKLVQKSHRAVAVSLCEKWRMPEPISDAVRDCGDYDMLNRTSPANFVRFANALTKLHGIYAGPVDQDDAKTMILLGRSLLGVDDDILARLTDDLRERVSGLTSTASRPRAGARA